MEPSRTSKACQSHLTRRTDRTIFHSLIDPRVTKWQAACPSMNSVSQEQTCLFAVESLVRHVHSFQGNHRLGRHNSSGCSQPHRLVVQTASKRQRCLRAPGLFEHVDFVGSDRPLKMYCSSKDVQHLILRSPTRMFSCPIKPILWSIVPSIP